MTENAPIKLDDDPDAATLRRPGEVLERVSGLTRELLNRWRQQGYVTAVPRLVGEQTIYMFPETEVQKLEAMTSLIAVGVTPAVASQMSEKYTSAIEREKLHNQAEAFRVDAPSLQNLLVIESLLPLVSIPGLCRIITTAAIIALRRDPSSIEIITEWIQKAQERVAKQRSNDSDKT